MTQTLGSWDNPRTIGQRALVCPVCGGELFSAFFNADGDAEPDDRLGARWLTVCTSCSDFFSPRRITRRPTRKA